MTIYLDFDGTVVEHEYPRMGRCNFGCIEVIKKLQNAGHRIILNTYRVECNDNTLREALKLLNEQSFHLVKDKNSGIELAPITEVTPVKHYPDSWNMERYMKTGVIYIDDCAADIPLKKACMTNGMMVDWDELDKQFIEYGIY